MGHPPQPIDGVLFDFHSTLVDQGDAATWVDLAWRHAGRDGRAEDALGDAHAALIAWADRVWEHARDVDPDNTRDLDPQRHRAVFDAVAEAAPGVDPSLADALYATLFDPWVAYDDAAPVLRALRERGVRTALLSNVGVDVRPVLDREGLTPLLDAVVLSCEVGIPKPRPEIFCTALEGIGVTAERALMVGDSWRDDSAAGALGVRTLILPRTSGPAHGLDLVLRLVGG